MRTVLLAFVAFVFSIVSHAQDSTVVYINGAGKVTSNKDSAYSYTVFTMRGNEWYGVTYYAKNKVLQSKGSFSAMDVSKPVGSFDNYSDSGILETTKVYDKNSELRSITEYYPSGKKFSYIEWKKNGKTEQMGWDEAGNRIPGFIVQQEAQFDGGVNAWRRYVEKNLDRNVPEKNHAKPGVYTVVVSFRIDKEGKITDVRAENIPPGCVPCAAEAVRVIQEGPAWKPAVQNNRHVIYRQRQSITFVLEDDKREKND